MSIWGWMDSPNIDLANTLNSGGFSTCDTEAGRQETDYDEDFYEGRVYSDALNTPSRYVFSGDWISQATEDVVVTLDENGDPTSPTVRLDYGFGIEEAE